MSTKRRMWRSLLCVLLLSLLLLTLSGFRWGWGQCRRSTFWQWGQWCDTWGCHAERRETTTWVCAAGSSQVQSGWASVPALVDAAAAQPQPVTAVQVPVGYLVVPYPWTVVIKPPAGPERTFVFSSKPIYDPSIVNELETNWPSPPGSGWRVYGADPNDLAKIQAALPPSGPYEVQDEAIYSFHAAAIEPTLVIADFDHVTQEWIPSEYVHAPQVPLIFEPHKGQGVKPGSKITFTHTLTNTATIARTFDLTCASDLGWTYVIALAQAPGTPVTDTGPVAPGQAVDLLVSTWVPPEEAGSVETVVVTATAQDDPAVTQFVVDRIYVWYLTYLPTILRGAG